jgi:hypothetical protein
VTRAAVVSLALFACSSAPATPPDAQILPTALPERLSQTGMYTDIAAKTLSPRLVPFKPNNVLWSDNAEKQRFYVLPEGATIDSSDMNHWKFPVGTQFFKQFSLDGKRLETRLVWRVGDSGNREADTLLGAYVWNDDESEAYFAKDGQDDLRGTDHDAPAADTCWKCHVGEAGRALGVSALQLGDVSSLPLSDPPAAGTSFTAPNPALGYLHANCGHCHNPNGTGWVDSHMILRLDVDEHDPTMTKIYETTVGVGLEQWITHGFTTRVIAGDPDHSALWYRMSQRTPNNQMPPLATEYPDPVGLELIRTWILSL